MARSLVRSVGLALTALACVAGCRQSFSSTDQRFVANVESAWALSGDGRDGELALAICSEAARAKQRRAPLLRIAPGRFQDCAGTVAAPALAEALTAARVVVATCSAAGEELLVREDRAVFARWPDDGLDGLACVGKCRDRGCGPPCSESALVMGPSACREATRWNGQWVRLSVETPWPRR
ncbi:MAG: hypothetical protein SFW67_02275 [Myxococcaceae bacterium]|nr:hypothetical protein [Myxococcaceae bacterium]